LQNPPGLFDLVRNRGFQRVGLLLELAGRGFQLPLLRLQLEVAFDGGDESAGLRWGGRGVTVKRCRGHGTVPPVIAALSSRPRQTAGGVLCLSVSRSLFAGGTGGVF